MREAKVVSVEGLLHINGEDVFYLRHAALSRYYKRYPLSPQGERKIFEEMKYLIALMRKEFRHISSIIKNHCNCFKKNPIEKP
jgi:hypothetical protein